MGHLCGTLSHFRAIDPKSHLWVGLWSGVWRYGGMEPVKSQARQATGMGSGSLEKKLIIFVSIAIGSYQIASKGVSLIDQGLELTKQELITRPECQTHQ